jgi:lipoprotein-anchoring transpeptidase ErfK/SrfK
VTKALVFFACAVAGAVAAVLAAGPTPAAVGTTGTTATTGTTTAPPPTTTAPPPAPTVIPPGVRVAGVEVGGLTEEAAFSVVRAAFEAPLTLTVAGSVLTPTPESLGAIAYVQNAVRRALSATPNADVDLFVQVRGQAVRGYVAKLAARFDRAAVDSRLVLRRLRPFMTRERPGRSIDRTAATAAIVRALRETERIPIALPLRSVKPRVTRRNVGPVIVIRRETNWLYLYQGSRYARRFRVATGEDRYPTPLGRFRIVVKWMNPWWYPPDSDWAKDEKPIPPGPGNPLGTRWMGISSPGVGIHGTPDPASIGYSVSHGCIRMAIPDAEWLFRRVSVGTTVFIVRA